MVFRACFSGLCGAEEDTASWYAISMVLPSCLVISISVEVIDVMNANTLYISVVRLVSPLLLSRYEWLRAPPLVQKTHAS